MAALLHVDADTTDSRRPAHLQPVCFDHRVVLLIRTNVFQEFVIGGVLDAHAVLAFLPQQLNIGLEDLRVFIVKIEMLITVGVRCPSDLHRPLLQVFLIFRDQ